MITNHLKDDTTSRYNSSGNVQNVKLSTERLFGVYCHGLFSSVNQKERWPWAGKSSEIKSTSETFSALKMPKDIPCTPHIVCLEVICWLQKSPKAGTRDLLKHPRTSSDGCTNKFPYILTMLPLYNQHFSGSILSSITTQYMAFKYLKAFKINFLPVLSDLLD